MANDTIRRQAAIDALCEDLCGGHEGCKFYPCDNLHPIQKLPSAERRGRWEWNNEDEFFYSCSNCGHKAYGNTAEIVSGLYNYCPNCGAKMEVEENEND